MQIGHARYYGRDESIKKIHDRRECGNVIQTRTMSRDLRSKTALMLMILRA